MENSDDGDICDENGLPVDDHQGVQPDVFSPYLPADFEHWSKCTYWNNIEAACLSLGIGPMLVINATDTQLQSDAETFHEISKRAQLTSRAIEAEVLQQSSSPHTWLAWFEEMNISVPSDLSAWVKKIPDFEKFGMVRLSSDRASSIFSEIDEIKAAISGNKLEAQSPGAKTKEINSLEKIVLVMALSGYAYDPFGQNSNLAKELVDDAAKNGIAISEDTVRKYLKRAVEKHLPRSE